MNTAGKRVRRLTGRNRHQLRRSRIAKETVSQLKQKAKQ